MRSDGIASLKEALVQAGFDSRPGYVAPQVMAERFQHCSQGKLTTNSRVGTAAIAAYDKAVAAVEQADRRVPLLLSGS